MTRTLAFLLLLAGLTPVPAAACGVPSIPTPMQLVHRADLILHVIADHYTVPPEGDFVTTGPAPSIISFQVVEVLKGDYEADTIELHGYLSQHDDFNDHPVPYTFVRSNGRSGSCYANTYREGGHFLLLLKRWEGRLNPSWAGLAPLNEQVTGDADPWLKWVRQALRPPWTYEHFGIEEVAPGVYAVVSGDPLGLANHSNAVFIVGDDDVVVVDTQFTLHRTREVLAALRQITDKPVGVLINTHWHDDHTFGNQVYREAFPKIEIIAQANTKADMESIGVKNRAGQVAGGPDAIAMFRAAIAKKTSIDGTPMSEEERTAYESTIAIAQEYLDEMPGFHLTLPTKTFEDRMTIEHGGRTIEIRYFGPAVTRGDAVVYLPKENVLIAGDLEDYPVPFAYGCDVGGWIAALDSIRALEPGVVVPGHGEVIDDQWPMVRLRDTLEVIQDQTAAAVARGDSLEQARAKITGGDDLRVIVRDNKMLQFLFDGFFLKPAATSAFNAALRKGAKVR